MSSKSYVKTAIRLRPVSKSKQIIIKKESNKQISVQNSSEKFEFDHVFDGSEQEEVFDVLVKPMVEKTIAGSNSTVIATGQTGSGKSYTMGFENSMENDGIVKRALKTFFSEKNESDKVQVEVSFVEVYNDQAFDLLADDAMMKDQPPFVTKLKSRPNGAVKRSVQTETEVLKLLLERSEFRKVRKTGMNDSSSRSHAIFTIRYTNTTHGKTSLLNLVDLAGSECFGKTDNDKLSHAEGKSINVTLNALKRAFEAIAKGVKHIPFNESVITRLLKESLGTHKYLTLLGCVRQDNKGGSLSTLRFVCEAKNMKMPPQQRESIMNYKKSATPVQKINKNRGSQTPSTSKAITPCKQPLSTRKLQFLTPKGKNFVVSGGLSAKKPDNRKPSIQHPTNMFLLNEPAVENGENDVSSSGIIEDEPQQLKPSQHVPPAVPGSSNLDETAGFMRNLLAKRLPEDQQGNLTHYSNYFTNALKKGLETFTNAMKPPSQLLPLQSVAPAWELSCVPFMEKEQQMDVDPKVTPTSTPSLPIIRKPIESMPYCVNQAKNPIPNSEPLPCLNTIQEDSAEMSIKNTSEKIIESIVSANAQAGLLQAKEVKFVDSPPAMAKKITPLKLKKIKISNMDATIYAKVPSEPVVAQDCIENSNGEYSFSPLQYTGSERSLTPTIDTCEILSSQPRVILNEINNMPEYLAYLKRKSSQLEIEDIQKPKRTRVTQKKTKSQSKITTKSTTEGATPSSSSIEALLKKLNEDTEKDLQKLMTVGKKRAVQIITRRTQHGSFKTIEDLNRMWEKTTTQKFLKQNSLI